MEWIQYGKSYFKNEADKEKIDIEKNLEIKKNDEIVARDLIHYDALKIFFENKNSNLKLREEKIKNIKKKINNMKTKIETFKKTNNNYIDIKILNNIDKTINEICNLIIKYSEEIEKLNKIEKNKNDLKNKIKIIYNDLTKYGKLSDEIDSLYLQINTKNEANEIIKNTIEIKLNDVKEEINKILKIENILYHQKIYNEILSFCAKIEKFLIAINENDINDIMTMLEQLKKNIKIKENNHDKNDELLSKIENV